MTISALDLHRQENASSPHLAAALATIKEYGVEHIYYQSVTITGRSAARGQYVTIWFTTTVQSDDGRHRASLAEVVLR